MAEISSQFKENVREWVTIDSQMKEAAIAIKDLRRRSNDLKAWIMDHMEESEIDVCHIRDGTQTLRVVHRESKVKPRKDEVIGKMSTFLSQHGIKDMDGGDFYRYLYEEGLEKRQGRSLSRRSQPQTKKRRIETSIDEEEMPVPEEHEDEEDMGTV